MTKMYGFAGGKIGSGRLNCVWSASGNSFSKSPRNKVLNFSLSDAMIVPPIAQMQEKKNDPCVM